MKINVQVGDTVTVSKWTESGWNVQTGIVEQIRIKNIRRREVLVSGSWWVVRNDVGVRFEIVQKGEKK